LSGLYYEPILLLLLLIIFSSCWLLAFVYLSLLDCENVSITPAIFLFIARGDLRSFSEAQIDLPVDK
jgi:hypothetical protein